MRFRWWFVLGFPALTGCFFGSDSTQQVVTPGKAVNQGKSVPGKTAKGNPPATGDVTLNVLGFDDLNKLIQGHRGKVVVMDCWSTSCEPCMEEFHNLVTMHKDLGEKVACVSLSFDFEGLPGKTPETHKEKVLGFLKKQGATFDNVISSLEADELYDRLDIGSIPAVLVYNPDSGLAKKFEGEDFTYKDVRALVEQLVGKQN